MTTYTIKTIADLLKVPFEHRDECLKELGAALAAVEFTRASDWPVLEALIIDWADDGDASCKVCDMQGGQIMRLQVERKRGGQDGIRTSANNDRKSRG